MTFLIGLLTLFMVLDCLILVLLVLIQLPKKDAGAGLAFGGAATDALFGAGSGNVLTKVTKYAASIFFVMAIVLSILQSHYYHSPAVQFKRQVEEQSKRVGTTPEPTLPTVPGPAPVLDTNLLAIPPATVLSNPPAPAISNPPAVTPSNAAPAPAPQK